MVVVGVNLLEFDVFVYDMICVEGVESCYIDYYFLFGVFLFGKVICILVNDVVLYGFLYDYWFWDGDFFLLDFVVFVNGWVSDLVVLIVVGIFCDEDFWFIELMEVVLLVGIVVVIVGNKIGDILVVIGDIVCVV